uniref:SecY-independent transporter protein n=1 Tax=Gelidium sclerophyllum TaxID=317102 RepID=A0A1D8X7K4_9FLOR|nr:SecY-independent transporter protein [Gelidium sclerophyllum]AOX49004.1 SecY-independent transporter protein [Gelidium sclerophyllum]
MFPITIYSGELFYRFFYIVISTILIILIVTIKFDTIILIEIIPLAYLYKKFTVVEVTDLIELLWFLIFSISFLVTWPVLVFQLNQFFKVSWYKYQIYYTRIIFIYVFITSLFSWILNHFSFLPNIMQLLIEWNSINNCNKILLSLDVQLNLLKYVIWVIEFHYLLNFIMLNIVFCFVVFKFFWLLKFKYCLIKNYRKLSVFCFTCILCFILPPDTFFQFLIFVLLFLSFELLYFFICLHLVNQITEQIYAHFEAIIKKNKI